MQRTEMENGADRKSDWRFITFLQSLLQRTESYFFHAICFRNVGILPRTAYYLHITTLVTAVFVFVKTIDIIIYNAATMVWNNGYSSKILFYVVYKATYKTFLQVRMEHFQLF